jgi:hypothetical protein
VTLGCCLTVAFAIIGLEATALVASLATNLIWIWE